MSTTSNVKIDRDPGRRVQAASVSDAGGYTCTCRAVLSIDGDSGDGEVRRRKGIETLNGRLGVVAVIDLPAVAFERWDAAVFIHVGHVVPPLVQGLLAVMIVHPVNAHLPWLSATAGRAGLPDDQD